MVGGLESLVQLKELHDLAQHVGSSRKACFRNSARGSGPGGELVRHLSALIGLGPRSIMPARGTPAGLRRTRPRRSGAHDGGRRDARAQRKRNPLRAAQGIPGPVRTGTSRCGGRRPPPLLRRDLQRPDHCQAQGCERNGQSRSRNRPRLAPRATCADRERRLLRRSDHLPEPSCAGLRVRTPAAQSASSTHGSARTDRWWTS
jgi:hypothetical protein